MVTLCSRNEVAANAHPHGFYISIDSGIVEVAQHRTARVHRPFVLLALAVVRALVC